MPNGDAKDTDPTDREFLVEMIGACFSPGGGIPERYREDLKGYLTIAQQDGHDPAKLYAEAVADLGDPTKAPPYETVALPPTK